MESRRNLIRVVGKGDKMSNLLNDVTIVSSGATGEAGTSSTCTCTRACIKSGEKSASAYDNTGGFTRTGGMTANGV